MRQKKTNFIAPFAVIVIAAVFVVAIAKPTPLPAGGLKKFSSEQELKNYIAGSQSSGYFGRGEFLSVKMQTLSSEAAAPDYSATNIQVQGVDEADIIKNDGRYIYKVSGSSIIIIDAYPPESAGIVSVINLSKVGSQANVQEIFVSGDRLVAFGSLYQQDYPEPLEKMSIFPIVPRAFSESFINVYDISDRSSPAVKRELAFNGTYYDSRMIGDNVYAIFNAPAGGDVIPVFSPYQKDFPEIYYFDVPDYSYQFTNIVSVNVKNDEEVQNKVFLLGYSTTLFVSKENIYLVYQKQLSRADYYGALIDEVLLPALPGDIAQKISEIGKLNISENAKQVALAEEIEKWMKALDPEKAAEFRKNMEERSRKLEEKIAKETEKSVVHKIAIKDGAIVYKAQGEVPGTPLNQFSMDEHEGFFRIATTTGHVSRSGGNSANHVYTLDEGMKIAGKLEDIAPGERIYSARFMGSRLYLVTFKKVDPLFVIDLGDPANPKILGKLKIPGYSDYLHPYDENHIIGVGKETAEAEEGDFAWYQGVKLSLFDVSDVEKPKELAKFNIGDRGTDSEALRDHKAFLFDKRRNLLVIPILLAEIDEEKYPGGMEPSTYGEFVWQGAYVLNVTADSISLRGRISHDDNESLAKSGYYFSSPYSVKRSLYIGDVLYTVSDKAVKANSLADMAEIKTVELPAEERAYAYY